MENEIQAVQDRSVSQALSIQEVIGHVTLVQEVMRAVMRDGEHYGKIPGCGDQPTLLKAGAEKLNLTFKLAPDFIVEVIDLGRGHREYRMKCDMYHAVAGNRLGSGVGSASTMESKWRYRTGPVEFTGKIVPSEYWSLRGSDPQKALAILGGKGYTAKKNDTGKWEIAKQGEKVEHDNPADNYNTCLKIGKKRALIDAVLTVTAASDIFTQDIEEIVSDAEEKAEQHKNQVSKAESAGLKDEIPAVHPQATEMAEDKEFNLAADQALVEQEDKSKCPCGVVLKENQLQYYADNPGKECLCYPCNMNKKAKLPYGKNRIKERQPGEEG